MESSWAAWVPASVYMNMASSRGHLSTQHGVPGAGTGRGPHYGFATLLGKTPNLCHALLSKMEAENIFKLGMAHNGPVFLFPWGV